MTHPAFHRLEILTGANAIQALNNTRVIIFGVGGVGSWCAEALIRSGIGELTLVDSDVICITNVNRQLQATRFNIGKPKTEELRDRLLLINPKAKINAIQAIYQAETAEAFQITSYDYVIDAIDSLTHKVDLLIRCVNNKIKVYSSMGAACRIDPTLIKVDDIWNTSMCALSRLVRSRLRDLNFNGSFQVVYSTEPACETLAESTSCGTAKCMCPSFIAEGEAQAPKEWCSSKKRINGSAVHITATFGMVLSSLVIRDVCDPHINQALNSSPNNHSEQSQRTPESFC
jgi:tRNA A37 threonylcarbamoyladenosine dehydratase